MHRHALSETAGMASSRSSRSHSFSSDKAPSLASSVTFQMPTTVRPAPAYIAASVASQTVTDHHNAQLRDQDADTDELQNAIFSEQALALLNAFLDHLLFAVLSSARSPALAAIRPAVSDVLKPRLARDAIEAADEELEGLLAADDDDDDDELSTEHARQVDRWDVEKVWKRTRLRIMVYTRLGELEDEDEERYVQQERGLSMDDDQDDEAGLVAWAAAIFLTSVIEYVAEQLLLVAGSAAFARMAARMKKLAQQSDDHTRNPSIERLIIEEPDVEKIALNSALGRLWRTWRKRVRSPMSPVSPGRASVHVASGYSSLHHRKASRETINTLHSEHEMRDHETLPEHPPTETDIAANIPLPMGDNDVNEIEVPGLAQAYEDEIESEGMQTAVQRRQRPSSVLGPSPAASGSKSNKARPMSMPMRPVGVFIAPTHSIDEESTHSVDGKSVHSAGESMHSAGESMHSAERGAPLQATEKSTSQTTETTAQDGIPQQRDSEDESPEPNASMVAFSAATGMGFRGSATGPSQTNEHQKEEAEHGSSPQVMRSKRMSIERPGPPGLVRTFSTRSSSLKSPVQTPLATPKAPVNSEGQSYLDDDPSDEEPEQGMVGRGSSRSLSRQPPKEADSEPAAYRAIGVARTSNNIIRSASNSPGDSPYERSKGPWSGGYVEVPPPSFTPTSLTYRNTPSPDARPSVPERSMERKQANRRSFTGGEVVQVPTQYEGPGPTSAPRRQESRSVSHGSSLPALQEVESNITQHRGKTPSVHTSRSVRTSDSPRRSPTSATDTSARRPYRMSTDDSTRPADKSSSDNLSLKRGASTSSSLRKQGVYPLTSSGRDSSASHRSCSLSVSGLSGRMSEEDRAREFDSLVKGQDTVKFTLTPQSVRDADNSSVSIKEESRRLSASSVTVYSRTNAEDKSFGTANLPNTTAPRAKGPAAASSHKPSPSRKVVTRPLARDPKIESESMRDFADFIRSTGPSPGQEKPVQPFVNISGNGRKSGNHSTSSLGRKMSISKGQAGSANGSATRARPYMEPRSPAGLSTGNGDLIDFIRQGPPDANHKQPRIPKNIAPFRTTVDSDTFDTMLGGHGGVEEAYGSAASTLESKDSTQTINSRTGLIPSPSVMQPAYSNTLQQLTGSMSGGADGDAGPHPTRTRRRIKDPYAIDISDEEDEDEDDEDEDLLTALPTPTGIQPQQQYQQPLQQAQRQPQSRQQPARQESLMDFLNDMDPPGGSSSKPQPFMLSEETIAAAKARAAASSNQSTPSLSSGASTTRNAAQPLPFGSISSSYTAQKPRLQARAPAVAGDVRGGGGGKTATSDLADFLKNSAPPEEFGRKEDGGVGVEKKKKRFWQRGGSKGRGKTYGDLP